MTEVAAPVESKEVYALFCGLIDTPAVQRIFQALAGAMADRVTRLHLLFQSPGGLVGDGVCLYNLFRTLPFDLTLYNAGTVASIAAIAYLGANERKASAHASFMIHRTSVGTPSATATGLKAAAQILNIDDERTEAILRQHLTLPDERWKELSYHDLHFSAAEAVEFGLASEIAEFAPPLGQRLYNL